MLRFVRFVRSGHDRSTRKLKILSCLIMLFLSQSLSGCGDDRNKLINDACEKINFAWDVYNIGYKTEIKDLSFINDQSKIIESAKSWMPQSKEYLTAAGRIFRDLSASDSGFTEFAQKANSLSKVNEFQWIDSFNYSRDFSPLLNFCGISD